MEPNKRPETSRSTGLATSVAVLAAAVLILLIFIGSRGLRDFDSALFGYAVATLFTLVALTYRYTLWIGRPPTWRYFRSGWFNFLSFRNFRHCTLLIPNAWWSDIFCSNFL